MRLIAIPARGLHPYLAFGVPLLACVLLGCPSERPERAAPGVTSARAEPRRPAERGVVTIVRNTQATIDDVKIGAGNFKEASYVDESGEHARGRVAALWISVRDDPAHDRAITVYPGKTFEAGSATFAVRRVTSTEVSLLARPKR